jgi:hypothetical protein
MADRVVIDSNASSPLIVSVAGVDAEGAQFNNVIFNGNQPPLRLFGTSYTLVAGISHSEYSFGKNVNEGPPTFLFTPPSGTSPIFLVAIRNIIDANAPLTTPFMGIGASGGPTLATGAGGGVCGPYFCPANFEAALILPPGLPDADGDPVYVNFCIFKNVN